MGVLMPTGKWQWFDADANFQPEDHRKFREDITRWLLRRLGKTEVGEDGHPTQLTEVQKRMIRDALTRRNRELQAQTQSTGIYTDEEKQEALATGIPLPPPPGADAVLHAAHQTPDIIIDPVSRLFDCPCCFRTLPSRYLEPEHWWKHVESDLCSGTCLLDRCFMKPQPFNIDHYYRHVREYHNPRKLWTLEDIDEVRGTPHHPFPSICPICNYTDSDHERVAIHISKELRYWGFNFAALVH
ncbi:uncharacterized protein BO97DRAFT_403828 [Aspergillus homomorphus CBS 101889]|uniref:Uncharacterized protein n=1 Tax=Aspergillus homomorphus (strain CBS 101889) TaxID=1450537 RepID=A0A395I3S7_ASPHC|nr:hypothetical protein BO97DRAFT_403828 [Aspergillus homomorphus CBS 101889]RAL14740.1 hypothetical protein BO97DRAFT_403828 [Aspergillus homomorphus CBS 101889]